MAAVAHVKIPGVEEDRVSCVLVVVLLMQVQRAFRQILFFPSVRYVLYLMRTREYHEVIFILK